MSYLTDLTVQAEACAGCHVGGPAEEERGLPALDANHDILAAGPAGSLRPGAALS